MITLTGNGYVALVVIILLCAIMTWAVIYSVRSRPSDEQVQELANNAEEDWQP